MVKFQTMWYTTAGRYNTLYILCVKEVYKQNHNTTQVLPCYSIFETFIVFALVILYIDDSIRNDQFLFAIIASPIRLHKNLFTKNQKEPKIIGRYLKLKNSLHMTKVVILTSKSVGNRQI